MQMLRHSKKLYEAFKANEQQARVLEEAFDSVESYIHRWQDMVTISDLRNTEERLDRKLERTAHGFEMKLADTRHDLESKIADTRHDLEKKILESEHRLGGRISGVERKVEAMTGRVLRWSFGFWITQFGAFVGLAFLVWRGISG